MATQVTLNSGSVDSAGSLALKTNGTTTAVTIDTSQNVGIGTSSPASRLNILAASAESFRISYDATKNARLGATSAGDLQVYAFDGSNYRNILLAVDGATSAGNVGIGTSSPQASAKLHVFATGDYTDEGAPFTLGSSSTNGMRLYAGVNNTSDYAYIGSVESGAAYRNLVLQPNGGNLLVGATTASRSAQVVSQTTSNTKNLFSGYTSSTSFTGNVFDAYIGNTTNLTSQVLYAGINGTSACFLVYGNGNVVNSNNSYGAISDIKLKENITDATPKLEKLNQVRVVNYNIIGSTNKQIGVVAQELEQIFPSMIEEAPDYEEVTTTDEDGNEKTERVATGTTTKSVKYSVFVPMLIKAIQEQQALITQLQADVAALKGASA
jgi:hypothetical protein